MKKSKSIRKSRTATESIEKRRALIFRWPCDKQGSVPLRACSWFLERTSTCCWRLIHFWPSRLSNSLRLSAPWRIGCAVDLWLLWCSGRLFPLELFQCWLVPSILVQMGNSRKDDSLSPLVWWDKSHNYKSPGAFVFFLEYFWYWVCLGAEARRKLYA